MWSEGDVVVWRSLAFGHVRFAMPHVVAEHTPEHVVLWLPGGTRGKIFAGKPLHEIESLDEADWSLLDKVWQGEGVLKLHRFGTHHSLWHFEDGWYVNLEEPWRASSVGWDTRDLALDIVVERDGSWRWKDEDHLAAAVERGWIDSGRACAWCAPKASACSRRGRCRRAGRTWRPDLPLGGSAPPGGVGRALGRSLERGRGLDRLDPGAPAARDRERGDRT